MMRLLIVDDSALMRRLLSEMFSSRPDFVVQTARDGVEAIAKLHAFEPDVITLDVHMPGMDGLACLDRIMVERPTPVVMVSSRTKEGAADTVEALALGAVDCIPKPSGAVSLELENIAAALVEKVRLASRARLSKAARLSDRLKLRSQGPAPVKAKLPKPLNPKSLPRRSGEGLVVVGASTGGPAALDKLLAPLPEDFAWPIVIAQHMPASFTGALAQRLDRICELTVHEVLEPTPLQPGHAYVGRGEADLIVTRRSTELFALAAPMNPELWWHPSVERLVETALDQLPAEQIVGVLMTGMGTDGAGAMARLHAAGGFTIAESEESSVVWGMPGALVQTGGASVVVHQNEIASRLLQAVGKR